VQTLSLRVATILIAMFRARSIVPMSERYDLGRVPKMLHSQHDHNTRENKIQRKRVSQNRKKLLFYTSNSAFKIKINNRQGTTFFF